MGEENQEAVAETTPETPAAEPEVQAETAQPEAKEEPKAEPVKAEDGKYVGFWIRFVALLIDGAILVLIRQILGTTTSTVIGWIYFTFMTVTYGATLGKMVMGIKVVKEDGSKLDWTAGVLREIVGKTVSAIILGIGYLMAAFDAKHQALHDKIAKTYVVYGKTSLEKKS